MPWPRYSGATLTPATPAIGTGWPYHHWRMSWYSAVPTSRSPSKAARQRPSATISSKPGRISASSAAPKARAARSWYWSQSKPGVSAPMITGSAELLHDVVGRRVVGVHVLHVVGVLERLDQPEHPLGLILVQVDLDAGQEGHVRGVVVDARLLQGRARRQKIRRLGHHLEGLAQVVDLLGARVEHRGQHVILGDALLLHHDHALAVEQVGHRAGVRQRAAVAAERGAHVRGGPVPVVGQALHQHRDTTGAVALVGDVLVLGAAGLGPAAAADGPVDVVVRDRALLGLLDGVVQCRVARRVAATGARGDLDVLDQLGEHLAAPGVDHRLLVLGGGPLGVAAHVLSFTMSTNS